MLLRIWIWLLELNLHYSWVFTCRTFHLQSIRSLAENFSPKTEVWRQVLISFYLPTMIKIWVLEGTPADVSTLPREQIY